MGATASSRALWLCTRKNRARRLQLVDNAQREGPGRAVIFAGQDELAGGLGAISSARTTAPAAHRIGNADADLGEPNSAPVSAATRQSHANASTSPPAIACPLTAATTGIHGIA